MVRGVRDEVDISLIVATSRESRPSRYIQDRDYHETVMQGASGNDKKRAKTVIVVE